MPTYERADLERAGFTGRRCTARSARTGKPCRRWAARGSNVCRSHGAAAPQCRAAAKRRLDQAADVLVQRLLSFALDGEVADPVALAAIRDALDRAGLNAKQAVKVEVSAAPWQEVFSGIARITREESRARRGLPDTPALPAPDSAEPIDAEVVQEPAENRPDAQPPAYPPWTAESPPRPGTEPMTLEQAAADMANERQRMTGTRRIRSHRAR